MRMPLKTGLCMHSPLSGGSAGEAPGLRRLPGTVRKEGAP